MSPARQFGRPRGPIVKSARVREIKLGTHANGDRFALFRHEGTRSSYWHSLPISLAERALLRLLRDRVLEHRDAVAGDQKPRGGKRLVLAADGDGVVRDAPREARENGGRLGRAGGVHGATFAAPRRSVPRVVE